jgi:hypothetical protein
MIESFPRGKSINWTNFRFSTKESYDGLYHTHPFYFTFIDRFYLERACEGMRSFHWEFPLKILEVGCGNCGASRMLVENLHPVIYNATDLYGYPIRKRLPSPIRLTTNISSDMAVKRFGYESNTLVLVSPPPQSPMDFVAIREWERLDGRRYIIYMGELGASDGCEGMYRYMMHHPRFKLEHRSMIHRLKDVFGGWCEKELFIFVG